MGIVINNSGSGTVRDGSITTAKIADGAVTPAKLNVAINLNNPNYFKNPAFAVTQGASSGTVSNSLNLPTASLGYPGETEWCIAASGGTPAYAFSTTNQTLTLTGAASTTAIYVLQRIESIDAFRLRSRQVTLSVELSNSWLTTVIWELFRPSSTADAHGTIASPTQTLIASGTWTVNSTLTRYSTTLTLPSAVSNGLEVRLRVGAQISGTWVVARPKLEEGGSPTVFTSDDYAVELAKCQRYAQLITNGCQSPATGNLLYYFPFRVPMFITPVRTTIANGTAFNASTYGLGAQDIYTHSFGISAATAAGSILGHISLYSAHIP
jgi:hypothetical protein